MENGKRKLSRTARATREALIDAFCELYAEKPIEKIAVKEITQRAGYSRITFYEYFDDTRDLLGQVEDEFIEGVIAKLSANLEAGGFAESFARLFEEMQQDASRYARVLLSNPNASRFPAKLKGRAMEAYASILSLPTGDRRTAYALDFYLSGIISVISAWYENPDDMAIEDLEDLLQTIVKHGTAEAIGPTYSRMLGLE